MLVKRIPYILGVVVIILLLPLIGMYFSDQVDWTLADFIVMGSLLFITGLVLTYIKFRTKSPRTRIILFILAIAIFILIWAELAVGIIGTPLGGN